MGVYTVLDSLKLLIKFFAIARLLEMLPYAFHTPHRILANSWCLKSVVKELGLAVHVAFQWLFGWQTAQAICSQTPSFRFYLATMLLLSLVFPILIRRGVVFLQNLALNTFSWVYALLRWGSGTPQGSWLRQTLHHSYDLALDVLEQIIVRLQRWWGPRTGTGNPG